MAFKTTDTHIISREGFSIEKFREILELRSPTDFVEMPIHVNMIINSDFPSKVNHDCLMRITSSGSIHSESLRKKFSEVFPKKDWRIIYGMTETDEVSWTSSDEYREKFSVGSNFFPNMTFKIVDANGQKLGINEPGELCVKQLFDFSVCEINLFLKNSFWIIIFISRDITRNLKFRRMQSTKKGFTSQETLRTSTNVESYS